MNNIYLLDSYYDDAKALVNPLLSAEAKELWCHDYAWKYLLEDKRYKPTVQVAQHEQ